MSIRSAFTVLGLTLASMLQAQMWHQNDQIFNPSGIPSLPFSQPRFADLDNDGDMDMILGSVNGPPQYFENSGSSSSPNFQPGDDLFALVLGLDCEIGVCVDLDNDTDLDFITGGYTGLQMYENVGSIDSPSFQKADGFFGELNPGSNPVPTFSDLDGDDDFDLVIGQSESGAIKYYENFGTSTDAIFMESLAVEWFDVGLYAYPLFSDLDADGDTDLLVGRDGYGLYYYLNTGTPSNWNWIVNSSQFAGLGESTYWNSPGLVDLNGDGQQDLVHGTASGPLKYYRNSGSLNQASWTEITTLFGGVLDVGGASNPVFLDFDADGDLDLLSGSQMGDIKYYENSGDMYAPAWTAQHSIFSSIDHSIYSAVAAGDLDGDGLIDLVVGDLSGNLFYHPNTGTGFPYNSSMFAGINVGGWSCPRLYDMDGDLDLDLVIGREDGMISYYENTGSTQAPIWTEDANVFADLDIGGNAVISFGDVDLNGTLDMITGKSFRAIQFFSLENGTWVEYPTLLDGLTVGQNASPALADLNGDGDLDLTVGNYDGVFNYFENLTAVDIKPNAPIPNVATLHPAYPNPFNPATSIRFDLSEAGQVQLHVFNLKGRLVKTWGSNSKSAGQHQIRWAGENDQGRLVEAGVYIVRLKTGSQVRTQKITLLK